MYEGMFKQMLVFHISHGCTALPQISTELSVTEAHCMLEVWFGTYLCSLLDSDGWVLSQLGDGWFEGSSHLGMTASSALN